MSERAIDMHRQTLDYERGYSIGYMEGLQKGLEELIKQRELDIYPIYFCFKCSEEVKVAKEEPLFYCQGCPEDGFKREEISQCKVCDRYFCKKCIITRLDLCLDCAREDYLDGGDC